MMEERREQQPAPPEPAPPLVVGVELTQSDFSKAWGALPQIRRQRTKFVILVLVVVLGSVSRFALRGDPIDETPWVAMVVPILFIVLLTSGLLWLMPRRWARQAMSDIGAGQMRFCFDAAGLEIESPLRSHKLAWAALPQHLETDDAFVIYTSSASIVVVPKRAFAAGQLEAARVLLGQRVPTKASKSTLPRVLAIWVLLVIASVGIWHFLRVDAASTNAPVPAEAESP